MQSVWRVQPANPQLADRLARELGLHPITAQLLLNRGVHDRAQAIRFLQPSLESLDDPYRLPDMDRAVSRLKRAIAAREPILIFGDSDVDGLTASVILYEALRERGAVVRARSSNRLTDGYGIPRPFAHRLARSSTKLLIVVDCGTNQPDEIRLLEASGIDTIIIDHHVPFEGWAIPHALVNPHRGDGVGQELCSAGLALKVVQALAGGRCDDGVTRALDLASLGTLADCAPLIGENRIMVSAGLPRIIQTHRPGLRRLCEETRTTEAVADRIVRRLTPRLNASGRLGDATAAWKLLLSGADEGIEEWVTATDRAHTATKQLRRRIFAEAQEQENRLHFRDQFVMVVSNQGWHQGVMGPLAAQLAERYGRPSIAIAMEEHRGVGSGRSTPLFNLLEALRRCQGSLVRFGGHAQACGLTVERRQLESFRALINQQASLALGREGLLRTRTADLELPLGACEPRWVEEATRLSPFGHGNPRPTVILRHLAIEATSARVARLSDGTTAMRAKGAFASLVPEGYYDVIGSPALVEGELVLTVSDVRASQPPRLS